MTTWNVIPFSIPLPSGVADTGPALTAVTDADGDTDLDLVIEIDCEPADFAAKSGEF